MRSALSVLVLLVLSGCGDTAAPPRPATAVPVGATVLAVPVATVQTVVVRVVDGQGRPVAGVQVTWTVAAGGGTVAPQTSRTDDGGEARTDWTLGTTAGTHLLTASAAGIPPATWTADAQPGPAASLSATAPPLAAAAGSTIAPVALVRDAHGNPVPGVTVTFEVEAGGGSVGAAAVPTDAQGRASAAWTIGTVVGPNRLTARMPALPAVSFDVDGRAGAPARLEPLGALEQTATVASTVPVAPSVRVFDAWGNRVPDVVVSFTVTAGAGVVAGGQASTGPTGEAAVQSWTLGSAAGDNTLTAGVAGAAAVVFRATGLPGAPASLQVSGDEQTATVATAVAIPPAVTVRDQFHNAVPGVAVDFAVAAGGGGLAGGTQTTGADGVARVGAWTLGTTAGPNVLRATAAGLQTAITATGRPGPATQMRRVQGEGQAAARGTPVATPPAVQVTDEYGNGVQGMTVTFSVASGGGVITGAQQTTDVNGIAGVGSWTLGAAAGDNHLIARSSGLPPVVFTALADGPPPPLNLYIEGVQLNQGSQARDGSIGAVSQRGGLLRVIVRANQPNSSTPPVRLRLFHGAVLVRDTLIPAPRGDVPVDPDLDVLSHTWNLVLAPGDVVPGMSVEAIVDPAGSIIEGDPNDNRFPRGPGSAPIDVAHLHPLRVIFIPIHATVQNRTGSITGANVETFLEGTRQWIPATSIITSVRSPYTTGLDLSSTANWSALLAELQAVRTVEGAVDQYYHGIIGDFPGIPYGGLAYRPSQPSSTFRSGLSYDRLPGASGVIAHELGHNLGRMHAPCGNPSGIDPQFPHAGATLGTSGFDVLGGSLRRSVDFRDYMSYCSPRWTSDYTYAGILAWRRADPRAQPGPLMHAVRTPPQRGLLVWGRITAASVTLEPAFSLVAAPVLPDAPGPNIVRGRSADGSDVFRLSFSATVVEDGVDPSERHFAFFVPLTEAEITSVASIEVSTPTGAAVRTAATPPPGAGPIAATAQVRAAPGDIVRVQWDVAHFPMALVMAARTGEVLSFARSGDALVRASALAPDQLDVILSDGVHSRMPLRR